MENQNYRVLLQLRHFCCQFVVKVKENLVAVEECTVEWAVQIKSCSKGVNLTCIAINVLKMIFAEVEAKADN